MKNLILVIGLTCVALVHAAAGLSYSQAALSEDTIKATASSEMKGIFEGLVTKNYELYSKNFSEPMKQSQDPESFIKLCEKFDGSLGQFKSFEYLGFYVEDRYTIALFKAKFSKIDDDVLVRLVLDLSKPKDQVMGLWFDSTKLAK